MAHQPVVFKERDIVATRTGRTARVLEVKPEQCLLGEREVVFLDNQERATMRTTHLTLLVSAMVQPWRSRTL